MKIQIKNRYDDSVIYECDAETIGHAVTAAILAKVSLHSANLQSANLRYANLQSANLRYANLRYANLRYANLRYANLRYANLQSANLQSADLRYANLQSANLQSADLQSADLRSAKASEEEISKWLTTRTILAEGQIIGWKKLQDGVICKLLIPAKAKRVGGLIGRKCRAEYAEVLSGGGIANHNGTTKYVVGKIVRPDKYDPNPLVECAPGIHFFITKQEAMDY